MQRRDPRLLQITMSKCVRSTLLSMGIRNPGKGRLQYSQDYESGVLLLS